MVVHKLFSPWCALVTVASVIIFKLCVQIQLHWLGLSIFIPIHNVWLMLLYRQEEDSALLKCTETNLDGKWFMTHEEDLSIPRNFH